MIKTNFLTQKADTTLSCHIEGKNNILHLIKQPVVWQLCGNLHVTRNQNAFFQLTNMMTFLYVKWSIMYVNKLLGKLTFNFFLLK